MAATVFTVSLFRSTGVFVDLYALTYILQSVGNNLASSGSTTFFAASVPSGSTQGTVFTTDHPTQLTISWQGI